MRRRIPTGAVAAVALAAVWCAGGARAQTPPVASPAPAAAEKLSPKEQAVLNVIEGFMAALNAADIDKLSPYFAPDATMFFPLAPLSHRLENKDQIVKVFTVFFQSIRKGKSGPDYMSLVPEDLRIQVYGDAALATFHFKGPDLISRRTLVLARQGGKWLVVHMHASGIVVAKE